MIDNMAQVVSITGQELTVRHELVSVYGHIMPIKAVRMTSKDASVTVTREDGQRETFGLTERVMVTTASYFGRAL